MKKLYRKGTVHPSPHIKTDDHLLSDLLPVAIFSLAAVLSPEDREVLAYLFCYTCYWVRWDSSPNRQLIHEIIDAFEDNLEKRKQTKKKKNVSGKKDRRKRSGKSSVLANPSFDTNGSETTIQLTDSIASSCACSSSSKLVDGTSGCNGGLKPTEEFRAGDGSEEAEQKEEEKGSVRRFVSFVGEKVFSVWG
ncbi:hypothetical protein Bca52824_013213 [Brassica carinata]|uniref:Uncharacterized protein n=1 Tax=Brassica carinata TaxID=52824 RepID=A0A8X7VZY1_BRACI|nr:hypothetical protein Bca52824_013213 [Brassica carinata]